MGWYRKVRFLAVRIGDRNQKGREFLLLGSGSSFSMEIIFIPFGFWRTIPEIRLNTGKGKCLRFEVARKVFWFCLSFARVPPRYRSIGSG